MSNVHVQQQLFIEKTIMLYIIVLQFKCIVSQTFHAVMNPLLDFMTNPFINDTNIGIFSITSVSLNYYTRHLHDVTPAVYIYTGKQ